MTKERIAVLYGGRSVEHEISIITALQAIEALDSSKYEIIPVYLALNGRWYTGDSLLHRNFYRSIQYAKIEEITLLPNPNIGGFTKLSNQKTIPVDACLLAFHGQYGEDGCLQGLLEIADLPYTGSDVAASAIAMNKYQTKMILQSQGIPVLPCVTATKEEAIKDLSKLTKKILRELSFPLFVKPNHLGSSIGISSAADVASLHAALAKVFLYDEVAIIEPQVTNLMEINVAVLDGDPPVASVVEIPVASEDALSYEDKYLRGGSKSSGGSMEGMAALTRVIDPKDLDPALKQKLRDISIEIFRLIGCSGVCRLDFLFDQKVEEFYFNELNPIPGSMAFYLWDKSDPFLLYTEVLDLMLKRAKEIKARKRSLKRDLGFSAL